MCECKYKNTHTHKSKSKSKYMYEYERNELAWVSSMGRAASMSIRISTSIRMNVSIRTREMTMALHMVHGRYTICSIRCRSMQPPRIAC